ncbi:hypothetical protein MANES_03G076816v8 [Manihot esculenta]|uniref:Uncharacterized protein n=1 Tax=Manihot esculenta TaxID=3983 RepID=A0ACB7HZA1_MANES|nr:hypothetical protein MANES_03G076816v8 [Manihot esculenta]
MYNKLDHYKIDCPKLKKHIKTFKNKASKQHASNDHLQKSLDELSLENKNLKNSCLNLFLQVYLKSLKFESKWYLDNGCSSRMIENSSHFIFIEKKDSSGQVTFVDNGKDKIVEICKVSKENSYIRDKVFLVDGLKHNLSSVSQLCDKGYRVIFEPKSCFIFRMLDNKILFVGERIENIYVIDLQVMSNQDMMCFIFISNNSWVWHKKFSHTSMDLLKNLSKDELVNGLPNIKFDKFDSKTYESIFLENFTSSKSYKVFNKKKLDS